MLIYGLMNLVKNLLNLLFSPINLPSLPDEFVEAFDFLGDMLEASKQLISLFIPWNIVKFGLPLVIAVILAEDIYKIVMWILRKIPMLGIE